MPDLNSKRAELRNMLAFWLHNPGQGAEGDPGAYSLHSSYSQGLTNRLMGAGLPPTAAAIGVDTLGIGNEALSGGVEKLLGGDFASSRGYDSQDIAANRTGIARALAGQGADPQRALGIGYMLRRAMGIPDPLAGGVVK